MKPKTTTDFKNSWFWWGLLFSGGIHFTFLLLQLGNKYLALPPMPEEAPTIEVTQLSPQMIEQLSRPRPKKIPLNPNEKEIAESEKADNNEIDPNAKFLSDKNQKAEVQTRAKKVDDFRKHEGTGPKGATEKKNDPTNGGDGSEGATPTNVELSDQGMVGIGKNAGPKKDWRKLSLSDLGVGGDGGLSGASDDRLSGVQDGDRTILSTREYKYFSYYHRIKELLRQYWKPMVEQKLFMMFAKGKPVGEDELTTRLLVLLTDDGKIARISRMTSSGFTELDDAAMEAFKKAGPFPNPPSGIVDPDGFVRIRWDFILKTEAAPRIQFSGAGSGAGARNAP